MNSQAFNYIGSDNTQSTGGITGGGLLTPNVNGSEELRFQVTGDGQTRGEVNNTGAKTAAYVIEVTVTYFTDA